MLSLPDIAVLAIAGGLGVGAYFFVVAMARVAMLLIALSFLGLVSYSFYTAKAVTLFNKVYTMITSYLGAHVTWKEFLLAFALGVVFAFIIDFAVRRRSAVESQLAVSY